MRNLASMYRPKTFDEVLGSNIIIKILERQIQTGHIKHAYMFSGGTGLGKTTVARIFSRELNEGLDVVQEIDAASNNGVENIRALVEEAQKRPLNSKYKIYILDECHMLTTQAWQPLLKILEDVPDTTIFIFCTTDPQKVPQTIMNRVQRFNFKPIPWESIKDRLEYVCKKEDFKNYDESIDYISKISHGCMREALTLLEKVADYSETFNIEDTTQILGIYSYKLFFELSDALVEGYEPGVTKVISIIENAYNEGIDLKLFIDNYLEFIIDVLKYIVFQDDISVTSIPSYLEKEVKGIVNFQEPEKFYTIVMDKLLELKNMLKNEVDVKSVVEVVCIQIARS